MVVSLFKMDQSQDVLIQKPVIIIQMLKLMMVLVNLFHVLIVQEFLLGMLLKIV